MLHFLLPRRNNFFWAIFLLSPILCAQTKFSYRVINENVLTYNDISTGPGVNADNILQLNEFEAENRFFPILSLKNEKLKIQFEPRLLALPISEELTFSVNELYAQYQISEVFYLKLGKERINWGTGNVWNPTNPFLQRDPFRLDNRLEGIILTDFEVNLKKLDMTFLFSPDETLEKSTFATRFSTDIKALTVTASYAYLGENKQQFGSDFTYGADRFVFYGEGVVRNFSNTALVDDDGNLVPNETRGGFQNSYTEGLLGSMINISANLQALLEYRHRSDYNTKKSINNFEQFLPNNLEIYEPITMGQNSFFGQASFTDNYSKHKISANIFFDYDTNQTLVFPEYTYFGESIKIEATTFIYNNDLAIYNFQTRVILSIFF